MENETFKSLNLSSVNFKIISFNDSQIQYFSLLLLPSAYHSWFCQVSFPLLLQGLVKMKWIVSLNFEWSSGCSMTAKRWEEVHWPSAPQHMPEGSSPHPPQCSQGRPGYKTCLNRDILRHWLHTNYCWVLFILQYALCCYVAVIKESWKQSGDNNLSWCEY